MVYADLKCFLEKIHSCQKKKTKHMPSGYSLFASCWFDPKKTNKLGCYRYKDCIKRFCNNLKEHATRITNYEKKKDSTDR